MTTTAITPLRQRMIEDMNARKLCAGMQRGHIRACKRFAGFLKRSPDSAYRAAPSPTTTNGAHIAG
jgi:integrase/recombinase XerD